MKKISLIIITLLLLVGCNDKKNVNSDEKSNWIESNSNSNISSNITSNIDSNSNTVTSNSNIEYDESKVGSNKVTLYLFYLSTCPHCHAEIEWLNTIADKYTYLNIVKHEVSENNSLYYKIVEEMNINDYHVPLTIIGNDYMIGYSESKNEDIINLIKKHSSYDSCDAVKTIEDGKNIKNCLKK